MNIVQTTDTIVEMYLVGLMEKLNVHIFGRSAFAVTKSPYLYCNRCFLLAINVVTSKTTVKG